MTGGGKDANCLLGKMKKGIAAKQKQSLILLFPVFMRMHKQVISLGGGGGGRGRRGQPTGRAAAELKVTAASAIITNHSVSPCFC